MSALKIRQPPLTACSEGCSAAEVTSIGIPYHDAVDDFGFIFSLGIVVGTLRVG